MSSDKPDIKQKPQVISYEGMEAANKALEQFEREHAGHRTRQEFINDNILITQCLDCGPEFREYYTPSGRP